MTDPTTPAPSPGGPTQVGVAFRAAGAACLVHALLLLGLAAFYLVELANGEGSGAGTVIAQAALILVFAGLLGVLARVWFLGSRRGAVPTVVWNVFVGIPVLYSAYLSGAYLLAGLVTALVLAGLLTTWAALRSSRPAGD